jgi:serine/threonine-protein kinase
MSDPPGADVTIYRYEEVDGVLTPGDEKQLGPTPVGPAPLPMGSYLCVLKKGGFRDTRYPVHITRERHWRGEVKLRADPERTVSLEDFAIGKYPVTCGEYGEFLDQLGDEKARERCPHTEHQALMERGEDGRWRVAWHAVDDRVRELCLERYGEGFESLLPVTCVSWHDSVAYCEWKSRMTGLEWRLPTEQEREKAARGVDGRHFAWGDLADSSLGKCRDSRSERPQPEPVGAFPSAESVYGMGDASGGVWDWTDSIFDERSGVRVLRGGSWNDGVSLLYCANRHWFAPARRLSLIGFRCARSL